MACRSGVAAEILVMSVTLAACGGGGDSSGPSGPGSLVITVATTGVDLDADGFSLTVDAEAPRLIPTNGSLTITEGAGSHTLTVGGLAFNCDGSAPASVDVRAATATSVNIAVTCTSHLHNAIVFVSDQFGAVAGSSPPAGLMIMRPDGSRREALTTTDAYYALPTVSPNGQAIAVVSGDATGDFGIFLLDRFGKARTKLIGRSNLDESPAWSPDGTKLAFTSGTADGHSRIFVINRDGSGLQQLTIEDNPQYGSTDDDAPSWSPDGQRIVFSRTGILYVTGANGGSSTSTGISGHNPAWSPDGTRIAYDDAGIYVMNANFTAKSQLTLYNGDFVPRWSPDGSRLVFERAEGVQYKLYVMNADGSGLTKISTSASDNWPTWSPQ